MPVIMPRQIMDGQMACLALRLMRMMPPMYGHHERTVATRISNPSV